MAWFYPSRKLTRLVASVTTVNDAVGASHKLGGVRGKEDAETVELVDVAQAVLGGQGLPDLLLGVEGGDSVEGSVHVTGGDAVDTDVVLGPLGGEGLAELNHTSLGGVVTALLLGVVDNGTRHGGNQNDGAGLASGHHGATDGLGHEEGTVKVDVDETAEHGGVVCLSLDVGIGNTGRVDQDIGGTVLLDNAVNGGIDGGTVTNVDLEEGNGKARLLVELSGRLVSKLLVGIEDDNSLGTGLSTGAGHVVTQTTGTTSDNDGLAEDTHVLHSVRHRLVDLAGQGSDSLILWGRSRAVMGDIGSTLRNLNGGLVTLALAVDGDGNFLFADNALLVGGVSDAVDAGGREEAGRRGSRTDSGSSHAGHAKKVAGGGRHDEVCWL
jgi:hypothetical protein